MWFFSIFKKTGDVTTLIYAALIPFFLVSVYKVYVFGNALAIAASAFCCLVERGFVSLLNKGMCHFF